MKQPAAMRHQTDDRVIGFMHVPKTAGTAVATSLRRALRPKQEVFGWDRSSFGAFRDFATLEAGLRAKVFLSPEDLPAAADLVRGHIALSTIRARYEAVECMTILREPMSRTLSQWLFMRSHEDHGLAPWGAYAAYHKQARQSLTGFLRTPEIANHTDNVAARMLLWPSPLIPEDGFILQEDYRSVLEEALQCVASLSFVDVVENSSLFSNLGRWLHSTVERSTVNETGAIPHEFRSPLARELTAEAYDLMEARTCVDKALWAYCVKQRMPGIDPDRLQTLALLNNVARFAPLMAPAEMPT